MAGEGGEELETWPSPLLEAAQNSAPCSWGGHGRLLSAIFQFQGGLSC